MNARNIAIGVILLIVVLLAGMAFMSANNNQQTTSKTQPTNAEMLESTNATEITTEDVTYYKDVKGYYVRPKADPPAGGYPGVVMIHENRGLRPEIKETAETLAKEGYQVLAVNLLGGVAEDQTGARQLTANFQQEEGVANMRAAAKYLRDNGASKIASWGWCFGGKQSLMLATSGEPLDATVVYYGGGMPKTTEELAPIKWPVLGIFGDSDQAIPVADVKTFENSLNSLGIKNEVYIYPGVGHAFANPSGANYAQNETKDAWQKTLTFLNKYLKTSSS